jgi:LysM repeat protein
VGQAQTPKRQPARIVGEAGLYPVAPGDTLWSLSRRFGVSLETMLSLNGEVDPNRLRVGQLVTIPGQGQPVAASDMLLFPVSAGDTLWGIARRFDVSVADLTAANPGIDPLRLREGQTLRVPSSLAAVAVPEAKPDQEAPAPVVSAEPGRLHSVVTGDTLWRLARRFGVSLDALMRENAGIDPDRLHVGQTVRLPGAVVSVAAVR